MGDLPGSPFPHCTYKEDIWKEKRRHNVYISVFRVERRCGVECQCSRTFRTWETFQTWWTWCSHGFMGRREEDVMYLDSDEEWGVVCVSTLTWRTLWTWGKRRWMQVHRCVVVVRKEESGQALSAVHLSPGSPILNCTQSQCVWRMHWSQSCRLMYITIQVTMNFSKTVWSLSPHDLLWLM